MGTAYRRLLHQERCFEQFFKEYPLSHCFILLFYICFLCFHSQRSFGFGESGLLFLSGKHSSTVVHTKLTIVSGLFFHLPQHHMAGSGGGYLDAFTTGQGLDTGGLFLLAFFLPSSLVLKKKTYTQQCTTLGSSPRQKFSTDSSMISPELSLSFFFSFFSFYPFGLERPLGKYPQQGRQFEFERLKPTHSLRFFPWLCFPTYDDTILMTTLSTTR
jgi:hypothetical protein